MSSRRSCSSLLAIYPGPQGSGLFRHARPDRASALRCVGHCHFDDSASLAAPLRPNDRRVGISGPPRIFDSWGVIPGVDTPLNGNGRPPLRAKRAFVMNCRRRSIGWTFDIILPHFCHRRSINWTFDDSMDPSQLLVMLQILDVYHHFRPFLSVMLHSLEHCQRRLPSCPTRSGICDEGFAISENNA